MEYTVQNTMKRRKILRNFSIAFLSLMIFLTFFSKTIDTFLLPEVSVISVRSGTLADTVEFTAEIEAEDTEKIYSLGDWKIVEVLANPERDVLVGMRLVRVDAADMEMKLKKKELEVLAYENALEKYKSSYSISKIDTAPYRRDAERALKEVEKCRSDLETIRKLYEAGSETLASVRNMEDKLESLEEQYAQKLETLERKEKEAAAAAEDYERTLKEKTMDLEIKRAELEELRKSMPPEDGYLRSSVNGRLKRVTVDSGSYAVKGQELIEIVKEGSPLLVKWKADPLKAEDINVNDEIIMSYERGDKTAVIFGTIQSKNYLAREKKYEFVSRLDNDKVRIGDEEDDVIQLVDGDTLTVRLTKRSDEFEFILPANCIREENGEKVVYVLRERKGALGQEFYVESVRVNVKETNGHYTAFESNALDRNDMIIEYSTKPIFHNVRVKLR